jgi:diguanylate cyclase (GGDEF)-like protein
VTVTKRSPAQEEQRLKVLRDYDVLDTEPEETFDRITRLARMALRTPIVMISLVDRDRQWFKSRFGIDVDETPRSISFCDHAIRHDTPTIVPNALDDPRFANNPLVLGEPHIRFYLGVPLCSPKGFNVGTLCAIDREPREASQEEVAAMCDLARLVVDELELRQIAAIDSLTGVLTRRSFLAEAERVLARGRQDGVSDSCIMLDVDHFKLINDRFGHPAGDAVLRDVARLCQTNLRTSDFIGRMGGEEFVIFLPRTKLDEACAAAERLRALLAQTPMRWDGQRLDVTASFGIASATGTLSEILSAVDQAMYRAKTAGRNRVSF